MFHKQKPPLTRNYSWHPVASPQKRPQRSKRLFIIPILLIVLGGVLINKQVPKTAKNAKVATNNSSAVEAASTQAMCAANALDQSIVISINQRHLWACSGTRMVYETPVITGMQKLEADLTPIGTYHIYAKATDTVLSGSDSTGSWNDPVKYWMPFFDNQYGTYGFHDATWRKNSEFGNIDPNSDKGSHGCVETTLSAAKWLYDWAKVGTTVTIQS